MKSLTLHSHNGLLHNWLTTGHKASSCTVCQFGADQQSADEKDPHLD